MDFDEYQKAAALTAVYPTDNGMGLDYCLMGLANEVGEVLGKRKKVMRGDESAKENFSSNMVSELGDVLWYMANIATELGFDLSLVAKNNINKLADRASRGVLKGSGDNR